jgi:hypothetical protein
MARTSVPLLFAALMLGGCTIVTYDKAPPRPPAPPPPRPAQPAVVMRPAFGAQPAARPVAPPPPRGATAVTPVATAARPVFPAPVSAQIAPPIEKPILFGNGTGGAFRGLAYVLQPGTSRVPNLSQMTPFATLFTDSFQIKPQPFGGGFPGALMQEDWFAIRYEGFFNVPAAGAYAFKLVAERGAALWVDDAPLIDAEIGGQATHVGAAFAGTATANLKAGAHRLRLDYYQAEKGEVALELFFDPSSKGPEATTPLVGITPTPAAGR